VPATRRAETAPHRAPFLRSPAEEIKRSGVAWTLQPSTEAFQPPADATTNDVELGVGLGMNPIALL